MKKAIRFSVVVCLVSWLSALLFHLITGYRGAADDFEGRQIYVAFAAAYMFIPLLTALALQLVDREKPTSTGLLRFRPRWSWVVGWLCVPIVCALGLLCNGLFAEISFTGGLDHYLSNFPAEARAVAEAQMGTMPQWLFVLVMIGSGMMAGVTVNAVAAFGEEYGWRNYMIAALREVKFWKAALLIGVVWGVWHFPMILMGHNYPDDRLWGIAMMVLMTLTLGIIELYFILKARSVYPAAIIHGTFNALAGIVPIFVIGGNGLLNGMTGLSGAIAMAVFAAALFVYDRYVSREGIFTSTIGESLTRASSRG